MFQTSSTTFTTFTIGGKTGETCQRSGPYKCTTTPVVTIFIRKGTKFPVGPTSNSTKGQNTTWNMVK